MKVWEDVYLLPHTRSTVLSSAGSLRVREHIPQAVDIPAHDHGPHKVDFDVHRIAIKQGHPRWSSGVGSYLW